MPCTVLMCSGRFGFRTRADEQQGGEYDRSHWAGSGCTKSDDGTVLKIDNKVVVNNDGMHPPVEKKGEVTLRKGRHPIELGA